jgi:hypothetical protein
VTEPYRLDPLAPKPAVMIRVDSYRLDPTAGARRVVSSWVAAVPRSADILHRLTVEVDGLPVLVQSFALDTPRCAACGGPLPFHLVEALEDLDDDQGDEQAGYTVPELLAGVLSVRVPGEAVGGIWPDEPDDQDDDDQGDEQLDDQDGAEPYPPYDPCGCGHPDCGAC